MTNEIKLDFTILCNHPLSPTSWEQSFELSLLSKHRN